MYELNLKCHPRLVSPALTPLLLLALCVTSHFCGKSCSGTELSLTDRATAASDTVQLTQCLSSDERPTVIQSTAESQFLPDYCTADKLIHTHTIVVSRSNSDDRLSTRTCSRCTHIHVSISAQWLSVTDRQTD